MFWRSNELREINSIYETNSEMPKSAPNVNQPQCIHYSACVLAVFGNDEVWYLVSCSEVREWLHNCFINGLYRLPKFALWLSMDNFTLRKLWSQFPNSTTNFSLYYEPCNPGVGASGVSSSCEVDCLVAGRFRTKTTVRICCWTPSGSILYSIHIFKVM